LDPRDNASDFLHEGQVMNFRAANEHQQEVRWRIFLMFVFMAIATIGTGLVSRGIIAALATPNVRRDATPAANHQPSSTQPADLYQATLVALLIAEVAGQLYILNARTAWELMNQPLPRPAEERPLSVASMNEYPIQRLDTS
jgi:hypothetical protein